MKDKILSIQSKVVYGFVGNNVAELAIQLHGLDVIAFPTVYLATHTGHKPIFGTSIDKKLFDDLVLGIKNLDIIKTTAHILSGYIGSVGVIESTAQLVQEIKAEYADKLYICDPVMGDVGRDLYVSEEVAKSIIEKLLPLCDVTTPNFFEFQYITGKTVHTYQDIIDTVNEHPVLKDRIVIVTSCELEDTPKDQIEVVIVKGENSKRISAPKVPIEVTGTGDLFTAITTARLAIGEDVIAAVTEATHFVQRALQHTQILGVPELNTRSILLSMMDKRFGK